MRNYFQLACHVKRSLYSRCYAGISNGGAYLRHLVSGLHTSEETPQRWRACADMTGPGIETQTSRTDSLCA